MLGVPLIFSDAGSHDNVVCAVIIRVADPVLGNPRRAPGGVLSWAALKDLVGSALVVLPCP